MKHTTGSLDDFASITNEEFDKGLLDLMEESLPSTVLAVSGVYEALSEEWNNEILDRAIANRP